LKALSDGIAPLLSWNGDGRPYMADRVPISAHLCQCVSEAPGPESVPDVVRTSGPLQVVSRIVGLVAVLVVHLVCAFRLRDESLGNEYVHVPRHAASVLKDHLEIAGSDNARSQDLPAQIPIDASVYDGPRDASYSPKVADFVEPFPLKDWFPCFSFHQILQRRAL
jgi:hypothetical protein